MIHKSVTTTHTAKHIKYNKVIIESRGLLLRSFQALPMPRPKSPSLLRNGEGSFPGLINCLNSPYDQFSLNFSSTWDIMGDITFDFKQIFSHVFFQDLNNGSHFLKWGCSGHFLFSPVLISKKHNLFEK